ncbi:hypothetical protein HPB52_001933 [Rhipicephalus sanguineus]|uniref:Peptidase S1 domain-containing protein n=1 Tax=Rhipicephalus sanguineus TaxID=34632 RepID=A0A9D4PPQ2_RHISA|nr:hypothetical protein HPB52_001933 [Rhipicephalus sanguineus]
MNRDESKHLAVIELFFFLDKALEKRGDCGLRNISSGKIVGGRPAKQCEFPWQVSLQVHGYHFCGGSILSPDTVVTAAHCLGGKRDPTTLDVVAGNVDLKKRSAHYQRRRVKSAARHENFGKRGMRDDIALLRLEEPFDFEGSDGCVSAVCLPEPDRKMRDAIVVSGWGTTREGGRLSTELLAVSVRVTDDVYCAMQYVQPVSLSTAYDKETMFCAGELFGGKDSCQVSLVWKGQHFCGGSLISPNEVVTAAHCITKYGHQKYDIGLLTLKQPFDFAEASGHIGAICLPPRIYNVSGLMSISGFGWQKEDGNMLSPVLQVATMAVLPNSTCDKAYGGRFHPETMFCAADFVNRQDSCKGDSGGPAMQMHEGRVVLAGIVSWGEGCGRKGLPGVYTRVSQYLDWIESHRRLR